MKKHIALTLGLTTLLAYTGLGAGQDELAARIKTAREEATSTSAQLVATLEALNALSSQKSGDLKPAYEAFRAQVPKTQAAAATTSARVDTMTKAKDNYFGAWQNTINSINNASLQKKAQKRLTAASKSYDKVKDSLTTAADKFRPFLSDLADVEKALSQDVTVAGVKNIKSVVRSANWNYKGVSNSINSALKEMQKMEKALSSHMD